MGPSRVTECPSVDKCFEAFDDAVFAAKLSRVRNLLELDGCPNYTRRIVFCFDKLLYMWEHVNDEMLFRVILFYFQMASTFDHTRQMECRLSGD